MCHPDAGKRYDCARALALWAPQSTILQRIDVQQWLEKEVPDYNKENKEQVKIIEKEIKEIKEEIKEYEIEQQNSK